MNIAVIGGLGRMGLRHCSVLTELGYQYDVFDKRNNSDSLIDYNKYNFFIIATPTETHSTIFNNINVNNNHAKILIEKPVVDKLEDLYITNHNRVFCGMIRRFDPLTNKLYKIISNKQVVKVIWNKSGKFPGGNQKANLDLGIHIIDTWQGLHIKQDILTYDVSYSDYTYDIVTIIFDDGSCEIFNYNDRTLEEYREPLRRELIAFLSYKTCHAYESHRLCLR